jgi:TonB family protein
MLIFNKILTSILFCGSCAGVSSQMLLDTVYFDRHWKQCKKDTALYYRQVYADMGKKVQFIVKDFYISGKIQMEGTYKAINPDVKNGHFVYFYQNGKKMSEANFLENQAEGEYYEWYSNGNKKSLTTIRNGIMDGDYKTWKENGIPQLEISYKKGELDGTFISYYDNGKPVRKDVYSNGEIKKKRCFTRQGKDTIWFDYLQMPEFPGGSEKLNEYIDKELKYPKEAKEDLREGVVTVEFSIGREGNIAKVRILKADKDYFNIEAIRLVSSFPKWFPGKKDGQLVEVTLSLPIKFRIKDE